MCTNEIKKNKRMKTVCRFHTYKHWTTLGNTLNTYLLMFNRLNYFDIYILYTSSFFSLLLIFIFDIEFSRVVYFFLLFHNSYWLLCGWFCWRCKGRCVGWSWKNWKLKKRSARFRGGLKTKKKIIHLKSSNKLDLTSPSSLTLTQTNITNKISLPI